MWARPRSPVERIGGVSRPAASRIQTALASGSPTAQAGYTHGFCGENAAPSAIDLALPVWISRHGNVLPRSDPGVPRGTAGVLPPGALPDFTNCDGLRILQAAFRLTLKEAPVGRRRNAVVAGEPRKCRVGAAAIFDQGGSSNADIQRDIARYPPPHRPTAPLCACILRVHAP